MLFGKKTPQLFQSIANDITEEGGPAGVGAGDAGGGSGKGMQVTAAGKAHMQAKKPPGSRVSLKPMDIVNKEIAEKRRRDKVRKYLFFDKLLFDIIGIDFRHLFRNVCRRN